MLVVFFCNIYLFIYCLPEIINVTITCKHYHMHTEHDVRICLTVSAWSHGHLQKVFKIVWIVYLDFESKTAFCLIWMFLWRTIRVSEERMGYCLCDGSLNVMGQSMCFVLLCATWYTAESITLVNADVIVFTTCEDCSGSGSSGMIHKSSAARCWWYFAGQKTSRLSSSCMLPSRTSHTSSGWLSVLTTSQWSIYYNSSCSCTSVNWWQVV